MQIETYLIEETEKMIANPEDLDEWKTKCEELNLKGQLSLVKEEGTSPIPFPRMTKEEQAVYDVLTPNYDTIESYKKDTIPLRILSLIALANKEKYFNQIRIYFDNVQDDPIAVGIDDNYNKYMIGRWGKELLDIPSLRKLAAERLITKRKADISKVKADIKAYEDSLRENIEAELMGIKSKPYLSI